MEIGRCPRCSHPYTASEVVGFGVLRPRAAAAGGPRMEYACSQCGRKIHLIPHGQGRYAPPGEPPPQQVPEDARRPPWVESEGGAPRSGGRPAAARTADAPPPASAPPTEEPPRIDPEPAVDDPMGPAEALELLGVAPTAGTEEIEQAFREKSRTCHPDKVAHLDAEFQELAEQKFKRLRRALSILTS